MVGDGLLRQVEDAGNVGHRLALRQQAKHLEFALGQAGQRALGLERLQCQFLRQRVVDVGLAAGDLAHRLDQHRWRRRFGDVALGAGGQRPAGKHHVLMHAEHQHARVRLARDDSPRHLDAAHLGQRDVHNHQARSQFAEQPIGLLATASLGHHTDVFGAFEQTTVAFAHHGVVVNQQHVNHRQGPQGVARG